MSDAKFSLKQGANYPYDASDSWWRSSTHRKPPKATDWAHAAARGVLADLTDRRGIKQEFGNVGEEVRKEMIESLAEIIREAHKQSQTKE